VKHPCLTICHNWASTIRLTAHIAAVQGQLFVEAGGRRYVYACACLVNRKLRGALDSAKIPLRYQRCSLVDYKTDLPDATKSLVMAQRYEDNFVQRYRSRCLGLTSFSGHYA
jgi:hypothetical protein